MDLLAQVFNGLGIGSIYALVALGYSMVYGIVQLPTATSSWWAHMLHTLV